MIPPDDKSPGEGSRPQDAPPPKGSKPVPPRPDIPFDLPGYGKREMTAGAAQLVEWIEYKRKHNVAPGDPMEALLELEIYKLGELLRLYRGFRDTADRFQLEADQRSKEFGTIFDERIQQTQIQLQDMQEAATEAAAAAKTLRGVTTLIKGLPEEIIKALPYVVIADTIVREVDQRVAKLPLALTNSLLKEITDRAQKAPQVLGDVEARATEAFKQLDMRLDSLRHIERLPKRVVSVLLVLSGFLSALIFVYCFSTGGRLLRGGIDLRLKEESNRLEIVLRGGRFAKRPTNLETDEYSETTTVFVKDASSTNDSGNLQSAKP